MTTKLELRDYQQDAINSLYQWLKTNKGNPCVVAPTGSGKAILIAELVRLCVEQWNGRVLVLAHVKELLEQEGDKLSRYLPHLSYSYYSAGIGEKEFDSKIVIAGIQSIYTKAAEAGPFNLILVDECHLVPIEGEGMYRTFLAGAQEINPSVRMVGFTATPFRTGTGPIIGDDKLFNGIAHNIQVRELIDRGFLSPLKMKGSKVQVDCSELHIRAGEFVQAEVESLLDDDTLNSACKDIVERTRDRKSVLIFTSSVSHAETVCGAIERYSGVECGIITGDTPTGDRDALNARFRGVPNIWGEVKDGLKYLVNVNVLTTGFDAPGIDCVALLRPTASPVLYVQMVGRGLRVAEGKTDCLILDYGSNAVRHGPIDDIFIPKGRDNKGKAKPQKTCPECLEIISAGFSRCPNCDYEFPKRQVSDKLDDEARDGALFVGDKTIEDYDVIDVQYRVWRKNGWVEGMPETVRCDYLVRFPNEWVSEWVCPEHIGYTRNKFEQWWKERSNVEPPHTAEGAVMYLTGWEVARPERVRIVTTAGDKFPRVNVLKFSPIEPPQTVVNTCGMCIYYSGMGGGFCDYNYKAVQQDTECCESFSDQSVLEDLPF